MITRRICIAAAIMILLPLSTALLLGQTKTAQKTPAKSANPVVVMDTSMGSIKIEVFSDKAPITAKNFLAYINSGFYNGTIFHRVIPNFVVQGGGYPPDMSSKPTLPPIKNEASNGLKNRRGTLSMARYDDPNSATSQFFINLNDNTNLDPGAGGAGYAVFAKVIEGMDVVDKIAKVKTATKNVRGTPFGDVPVEPVLLKSVKVQ